MTTDRTEIRNSADDDVPSEPTCPTSCTFNGHEMAHLLHHRAVIVISVDTEYLHEAIGTLQRFLSAHRINAPEDQMFFGPTMHVAIEEKAEEVLKVFEMAPEISESES